MVLLLSACFLMPESVPESVVPTRNEHQGQVDSTREEVRKKRPAEVDQGLEVVGGAELDTPLTPLAKQALDAERWLVRNRQPPPSALDISSQRTLQTLRLLASSEDVTATLASFERIPIVAKDKPKSWEQPEKFRMTRYLVYESNGSQTRTESMNTALYATPPGGLEGITRQQVYAGELEGKATPLVWLSREDANRAMMQGTVHVQYVDGNPRVFNVHENNGIPYDRAVTDSNLQARFWSFREVRGVLGFGEDDKIPVHAMVAVAGDVAAFGAGRVFLLKSGKEEKVVVLADTGGAFDDNQHQLDWYTGIHPSHEAFLEATKALPHHVDLYALVAPEEQP